MILALTIIINVAAVILLIRAWRILDKVQNQLQANADKLKHQNDLD